MKKIFARLWAGWGLITFVITFLIFFIPSMIAYLIPEPKGQSYFIGVSKIWMNVWLFLIGCNVTVSGKSNFRTDENYIVVFNHNALLDVPLSAPYVPGANKTIAKASYVKVPLFGWFYKKGAVLVNRTDERSRIKSFEDMRQVLANDMHMCIYPEGTRNRTPNSLKSFYDGAFKLAVSANKKIIPCVITGTKTAMPIQETFYLLPTPLAMHFMPPVSPANKTVAELKAEVFAMMKEEFERREMKRQ